MAISESWLCKEINNSDVSIDNYYLFRLDRASRGGGIILYVSDRYKPTKVNVDIPICDTIEYILVKIKINNYVYTFGLFYRAPNSKAQWFNDFEALVSYANLHSDRVVILGDFNCDFFDEDAQNTKRFSDILSIFNMKQVVEEPTRVTANSSTLIDLICLNDEENIVEVKTNEIGSLSDHRLVRCTLDLRCEVIPSESRHLVKRNYNDFDYSLFNNDALRIDWQYIQRLQTIDEKLEFVNLNIVNLFDKHAPLEQLRLTNKPKPKYITPVIRLMIKERNVRYRKYLKSKTSENFNSYREMRNFVTNAIKQEKKAYFAHKINVKSNDSRALWKFFSESGVHRKKQNKISDTIIDVDEMNNFFITNVPKCNISNPLVDYYFGNKQDINRESFALEKITVEDCVKLIHGLKSNSYGSDSINALMIKTLPTVTIAAIAYIINDSFDTCQFPSMWKSSLVIPVAKVENAENYNQLRPINLIPTMSKLCERVVFNQISEYVEKNNILPEKQSGFRSYHSTSSALQKIAYDTSQAIDDNKAIFLVCLDFSKAFEMVNHELMLAKFAYYGFSDSVLLWLKSYLVDRMQAVKHRNSNSSFLKVEQGVPQGSILGPLLFSIFTADIVNAVSPPCQFHLYADDTQIYISSESSEVDNRLKLLNDTLARIHDWSSQNGLKLNTDKTTAICIGNRCIREKVLNKMTVPISINGQVIELGDCFKNLGLYIDKYLCFKEHVTLKCRLGFARLKTLYQYKDLIPGTIKFKLANSLVLSQIDYCLTVYYSYLCVDSKKKLQLLQNACLRFSFHVPWKSHITPYYISLNILKIEYRFTRSLLNLIYKILCQKCPKYLYNMFTFVESEPRLRRRLMLLPKCKLAKHKCSFPFVASKLYNDYYEIYVTSASLNVFSDKILNTLYCKQNLCIRGQ